MKKAGQERANSALVLKVHICPARCSLVAAIGSRQKYFISRDARLPTHTASIQFPVMRACGGGGLVLQLKCYGAPLLPASSPFPAWDISRCEVGRDPLFRLNTCVCAMYDHCTLQRSRVSRGPRGPRGRYNFSFHARGYDSTTMNSYS